MRKAALSFVLFCALALHSKEVFLKSGDGAEKVFDLVGVSQESVFVLQNGKAVPIRFTSLDRKFLAETYPEIIALSEFSKTLTDLVQNGEIIVVGKKQVTRYVGNDTSETVWEDEIVSMNRSDREFAELKKMPTMLTVKIKEIYDTGVVVADISYRTDDSNRNRITVEETAFLINLPPKRYQAGEKFTIKAFASKHISYYVCAPAGNFDQAVRDISLLYK